MSQLLRAAPIPQVVSSSIFLPKAQKRKKRILKFMRSLLRNTGIGAATDSVRLLSSVPRKNHHRIIGGGKRTIVTCRTRRAIVLPQFGGPDVLQYREDFPIPDLQPNEVLVRARATSVNPIDLRMRAGYGRAIFGKRLPFILGRELSGEVAAVGSSVKSLSVGQEVFGTAPPDPLKGKMGGTYTDHAVLSEDQLILKPASISHVEASAISFVSMTAWCAIKGTAGITEGQRVLVFGGAGAVGFAAIQLAVAAGCHVTTTCGSGSIDRVLKAGAEQAINYTQDVESTVKGKFDAVFDTIGGPETERIGINLAKKGGHYLSVQGSLLSQLDKYGIFLGLPIVIGHLMKKKIQYRASHGVGYSWVQMQSNREGLEEILRLTEAGKLKIPVDETFPLVKAKEAHEAKENGQIRGKIVLEID